MSRRLAAFTIGLALVSGGSIPVAQQARGIFTGNGDIGVPSTLGPGAAAFDAVSNTYTVSGGGENMWGVADHVHYVWKKISGDVRLDATIAFTGTLPSTGTPNAHRKAVLMIRQSLDPDAVYADAAVHGDGLTSLQWRDATGAVTHEVQASVTGPTRLRIEKRGHYVSMSVASGGEPWQPAGGSARVDFTGASIRPGCVTTNATRRSSERRLIVSSVLTRVVGPVTGGGVPSSTFAKDTCSIRPVSCADTPRPT